MLVRIDEPTNSIVFNWSKSPSFKIKKKLFQNNFIIKLILIRNHKVFDLNQPNQSRFTFHATGEICKQNIKFLSKTLVLVVVIQQAQQYKGQIIYRNGLTTHQLFLSAEKMYNFSLYYFQKEANPTHQGWNPTVNSELGLLYENIYLA